MTNPERPSDSNAESLLFDALTEIVAETPEYYAEFSNLDSQQYQNEIFHEELAVLDELQQVLPDFEQLREELVLLSQEIGGATCEDVAMQFQVELIGQNPADESTHPLRRLHDLAKITAEMSFSKHVGYLASKDQTIESIYSSKYLTDDEKLKLAFASDAIVGVTKPISEDVDAFFAHMDALQQNPAEKYWSGGLGNLAAEMLDDQIFERYNVDPTSENYSDLRKAFRLAAILGHPDLAVNIEKDLQALGIPEEEFRHIAGGIIGLLYREQ